MITIKNDKLTVEISENGAELQSVKTPDGREWLWNGDKTYWTGRAPICFPICGGLKDDQFIWNGKTYNLNKHGFAKKSVFSVGSVWDSGAVLTLASSEATKEMYPFDFVLYVIYELDGNSLKVTYKVENTGTDTMFFSIGAHEGYMTPEGIEDYKVVFYYVGFMPDAYSMNTDKPVDSSTGVMFESTLRKLSESEATMGFDYVFVNGKKSAVTVQIGIYDNEGTQLSLTEPIEVPLKRSHHTIMTGMFLMSEASGGVTINPDFDGDHNLIFP